MRDGPSRVHPCRHHDDEKRNHVLSMCACVCGVCVWCGLCGVVCVCVCTHGVCGVVLCGLCVCGVWKGGGGRLSKQSRDSSSIK